MSFEYLMLEDSQIQLIDGDRGKNYPKQNDFQDTGYCLFLSAKNVTKTGFQFSEKIYISEERHSLLRAGILKRNDIVLTTRGTVGNVAFYDSSVSDEIVRINSGMLILRPDQSVWNPRFLYFLFTSKIIQEQITSLTSGSAVPQLPAKDLKKFSLPKVPMTVQNYIVKVIGDVSDKLDINNQTNQTLEQMAQAIFKSWFVDFDPVKAKMNGEQPEGMDAATASLFPEKLVESELGLIPEGWEIKPIKDLCTKVQNGGTPKRNEKSYWDDGTIPWLTSGEVRQSIITAVENRITQLGLDKSSAKWVPELSTLVALYGATAGEVSLTSIPLTTNQAVCALMPKKEHQWYNYLQLKNRVAELAGKAVGSAQQNISKGLVESTEVLSVPESLLEAFNSQVENLFRLRICNLNENVELAKLRDTLLPKLLSGEIELGTSEELVEAI